MVDVQISGVGVSDSSSVPKNREGLAVVGESLPGGAVKSQVASVGVFVGRGF